MTPSEYQTVRATIIRVWPRVAQRMTETDWKIIAQKCAGLNVSPEQAEAAMEELKATDEKYPSVAKFIATIRKCEVRRVRTAETAEVESIGPGARLAQMRAVTGLSPETPDGKIVATFYAQAAERSYTLRGYLRECWSANAHRELVDLGHWGSDEADQWVFDVASRFPTDPPAPANRTDIQRWYSGVSTRKPTTEVDQA